MQKGGRLGGGLFRIARDSVLQSVKALRAGTCFLFSILSIIRGLGNGVSLLGLSLPRTTDAGA